MFEAKFMLPWSFSEEAAAETHMAQLASPVHHCVLRRVLGIRRTLHDQSPPLLPGRNFEVFSLPPYSR